MTRAPIAAGVKVMLVLVLVVGFSWHAFRRIPHADVGVDDANIFLVYARNLAHGHGFVYHPTGERVEGFSSPAWVVLAAACHAITPRPEPLLRGINAVLVTAALVLMTLWLDRLSVAGAAAGGGASWGLTWPSAAFLGWTLAVPGYLGWTVLTLMETGLWSALVLLVPLALHSMDRRDDSGRERWIFGVGLPLLILSRPEGVAWAGVAVALHGWLVGTRRHSLRAAIQRVVYPMGMGAATLALVTGARMAYFGYPLPNTYYAKVSPDLVYRLREGWSYLMEFARSNRLIPWLGALSAATVATGMWGMRTRQDPGSKDARIAGAWLAAVCVCVGAVLPVLEGGDHFGSFRFYQPIWPLLCVPLLGWGMRIQDWLVGRSSAGLLGIIRLSGWVAAGLLVWAGAALNSAQWKDLRTTGIVHEFALAQEGREWGDFLNALFSGPDKPTVGALAVGGIQYAYQGRIIDLLGLNNVEMAHYPGDRKGIRNHAGFSREVFWRQQPDLVILAVGNEFSDGPFGPDHPAVRRILQHRWIRAALKGLLDEPDFLARYRLALIRSAQAPANPRLVAYVRNDYLAGLMSEGGLDIVAASP